MRARDIRFQLSFVVAAGVCLVASPARAQQEDRQLWLQLNTNIAITGPLRLTLEQIARFGDQPNGLYQTELGGLFGYRVGKNVELGFGYRHVSFHNGNTSADEDRLRQQVVATFGQFSARFRIDERFHPAGREVGIRIRPLIRYNRPLGKGLGLFLSHESFFLPNSTSWGQRQGYERMRNIVGVAFPIGKALSADIGYLNQYRFARDGAPAQMDHALTLQLTLSFSDLIVPHADD